MLNVISSHFDLQRTLRLHSTIGSIQEVSGRLKDFPRERRHGLRHHKILGPSASFDVRPQNLGVTRRSPMETLIILLALATVVVPALTEFAAARSLEGGE